MVTCWIESLLWDIETVAVEMAFLYKNFHLTGTIQGTLHKYPYDR